MYFSPDLHPPRETVRIPPPTELVRSVRALRRTEEPLEDGIRTRLQAIFFGFAPPRGRAVDLCLVLGSRNCGYRAAAALDFCAAPPTRFVVTGGNPVPEGGTEAELLRARLIAGGVPAARIKSNFTAVNTRENLAHSLPLITSLLPRDRPAVIALVTASFHLPRTLPIAHEHFATLPSVNVIPVPAYGPNTGRDTWHLNPTGRALVAEELEKLSRPAITPAP